MMCLICNSMTTAVNKYNAFQHYAAHKNHKRSSLQGKVHQQTPKKIKLENHQQRLVLQTVSTQGTNITQATNGIACNLGKMQSDVEIITDCIIAAVSCLGID